jgi:hypothetical protein
MILILKDPVLKVKLSIGHWIVFIILCYCAWSYDELIIIIVECLQAVVTLYHVSDASGEMTMNKVGEKPLHQDMLNSAVSKQIIFCLSTSAFGIL